MCTSIAIPPVCSAHVPVHVGRCVLRVAIPAHAPVQPPRPLTNTGLEPSGQKSAAHFSRQAPVTRVISKAQSRSAGNAAHRRLKWTILSESSSHSSARHVRSAAPRSVRKTRRLPMAPASAPSVQPAASVRAIVHSHPPLAQSPPAPAPLAQSPPPAHSPLAQSPPAPVPAPGAQVALQSQKQRALLLPPAAAQPWTRTCVPPTLNAEKRPMSRRT